VSLARALRAPDDGAIRTMKFVTGFWYAWRTRGRSGWRLTLVLYAVIWCAPVSWYVVAWSIYGVRYAIWCARWG
jgi:hypothetical protein